MLLVDTRERAVIPHLPESVRIQQINTGDYILMDGERIIICFERKTYKDFAASFRDGRYKNFNKLKQLRDETGCKIIIILEDIAPCRRDQKIHMSNLSYNSIDRYLYKLTYRDNIFVEKTSNPLHTAQMLTHYAGFVSDAVAATPSKLLTVIPKTDREILLNIWSSLPGISARVGAILMKHISISDALDSPQVAIDLIKEITGKKLIKRGCDTLHTLSEHRGILLRSIPGIASKTADKLLSMGDLPELIGMETQDKKICRVQKYLTCSKIEQQ